MQSDGLDRRCKSCKAANYAKIDKSKRSKWRKEYFEKNKEQELLKCLEYKNAHKDYYRKYHSEHYKKFPYKGTAKTAKYRASKLRATPSWITDEQLKEIEMIYKTCPKGYHVDHIIPLQGKTVSGLHVPWNLQHLPAKINHRKSNRLDFQE